MPRDITYENGHYVSLEKYVDRILEEKEKALQAALIAKEKALIAESAKTALLITVTVTIAIFVLGSVGSVLVWVIFKR